MTTSTQADTSKLAEAKVGDLAVLPQVVFKIVEMTGAEDSSAAEIERAIVVDPGFSAKVLQQANSAFFALPRKVTSIREAVMFLGLKSVRQVAMNVGVFDLFVGKTDEESLRRRGWWRLSVDTAVCAGWLGQKSGKAAPEEAYTCGLLHLIGRTLLDKSQPEGFAIVESMVAAGAEICDAERSVYGVSHVEVSIAAAMKWGFPEVLINGLDYLLELDPADPMGGTRACITMGHSVAEFLQNKVEDSAPEIPEWARKTLGIEDSKLGEWIDGATMALANAAKSGMG